MHATVFAGVRERVYHHCGRARRSVAATVDETRTPIARLRGKRVPLSIDRRTQITNRPAYEPLRLGQRLRAAVAYCWARPVARWLTFVGAPPSETAYHSAHAAGASHRVDIVIVAGISVFVLLLILARRTRRR